MRMRWSKDLKIAIGVPNFTGSAACFSRRWVPRRPKLRLHFARLSEHLLQLDFIDTCTNVIFAGPTGVGKSHLAIALGYAACLRGHSVLFAAAIDLVNRLSAAESSRQLAREIKHYQSPKFC
jgi:hypothetical protein